MEEIFVLKTKLGGLKGRIKVSRFSHKNFYAFLGIPYAKPPLGNLRFKAPQPYGSWEGVRNATEDSSPPIQPPMITPLPNVDKNEVSIGAEDCLYLNIYMTELPETKGSKKPVMFHIHGGGFLGGDGSFKLYGPDYIMNEQVVMVSVNYRCGAFGFLSLESEEVPGNAGLKDQTLALQWVKDNIDSFGGDPNNVTIFGISAGGASVQYHLLSKSSKELFHKAIIQSGFSNSGWAFQPEPRKIALRLAKQLGCTSENNEEILHFLQSTSAVDIVEATSKMAFEKKELMNTATLIFTPCVEVGGINPFLTDTPDNLMKKGEFNKVPVIIGCTMNEGGVCTFLLGDKGEQLQQLTKTPEECELLTPPFLGLMHGSNEEKEAGKAIWNFYFRDNSHSLDRFHSDVHFNICMEKTRKYLVNKDSSPVFSYLFTNNSLAEAIVGTDGVNEEVKSNISLEETSHGSDIAYLTVFGLFPLLAVTPDFREAVIRHVKAWTRFAADGDPNCKELGEVWEPNSKTKPCYMDIGKTWKMKQGIPFSDRIEFWNTIAAKYSNIS